VTALTSFNAPLRERDPQKWSNDLTVAFLGDVWFWMAILCVAGIDEHHGLWPFRCALAQSSRNGWEDGHRLHARLIRDAPQRVFKSPRAQLMAHPILRIARLKYHEGSIEQNTGVAIPEPAMHQAGIRERRRLLRKRSYACPMGT
jgi:hypothetical protein